MSTNKEERIKELEQEYQAIQRTLFGDFGFVNQMRACGMTDSQIQNHWRIKELIAEEDKIQQEIESLKTA